MTETLEELQEFINRNQQTDPENTTEELQEFLDRNQPTTLENIAGGIRNTASFLAGVNEIFPEDPITHVANIGATLYDQALQQFGRREETSFSESFHNAPLNVQDREIRERMEQQAPRAFAAGQVTGQVGAFMVPLGGSTVPIRLAREAIRGAAVVAQTSEEEVGSTEWIIDVGSGAIAAPIATGIFKAGGALASRFGRAGVDRLTAATVRDIQAKARVASIAAMRLRFRNNTRIVTRIPSIGRLINKFDERVFEAVSSRLFTHESAAAAARAATDGVAVARAAATEATTALRTAELAARTALARGEATGIQITAEQLILSEGRAVVTANELGIAQRMLSDATAKVAVAAGQSGPIRNAALRALEMYMNTGGTLTLGSTILLGAILPEQFVGLDEYTDAFKGLIQVQGLLALSTFLRAAPDVIIDGLSKTKYARPLAIAAEAGEGSFRAMLVMFATQDEDFQRFVIDNVSGEGEGSFNRLINPNPDETLEQLQEFRDRNQQ